MRRLILILFATLLVLPVTLAVAETPQEIAAAIDADLRAAEATGFGGAVIVRRGGETLLRRGYGFADREARAAFTPETVAQIGSITKTFTGLAAARLIAEGRIDSEATVGTYLPDAPEPGRSLVINDVLTHHSGLVDSCGDDFERLSTERLVAHCLAQPLAHPRGENHYSNLGYSTMARIVEAVSGQSWEAYLAEHVWGPLEMHTTGFASTAPNGHSFAHGYLDDAEQEVISARIAALGGEDWNLRGNGGMQASSDDMMRFLVALTGDDPAISPEARAIMLAPHGPREEAVAEGYGLFLRYDEAGALFRAGHAGSDGVFMSYIAWFPQSGTLVYFVGNNGEGPVREALVKVLRHAERMPPAGT
ncbi:MAG: serine hydrolase [Sphingomonadaceae bacterium]|nr:serine hydrolase [Sphingomonadaceae bacterium]